MLKDAESRPHFYNSLKDLATDCTIMPIAGGIPLAKGDDVVGGIGASGGSAEQDVEVLVTAMNHLGLTKGNIGNTGSYCFKI